MNNKDLEKAMNQYYKDSPDEDSELARRNFVAGYRVACREMIHICGGFIGSDGSGIEFRNGCIADTEF